MSNSNFQADVIIVGAGLAGMVAAHEAVQRGRKVLLLDQEAPQSLGGQAFWSLGGLFMVDTPEQRRLGIKDSPELALSDWMGSAQFDREEDNWPSTYAEGFIDWAAGGMRQWCYDLGMRWFPVVGWAERGGEQAAGQQKPTPEVFETGEGGAGLGPFVLQDFEDDGAEDVVTVARDFIHEERGAVRLRRPTLPRRFVSDGGEEVGQGGGADKLVPFRSVRVAFDFFLDGAAIGGEGVCEPLARFGRLCVGPEARADLFIEIAVKGAFDRARILKLRQTLPRAQQVCV